MPKHFAPPQPRQTNKPITRPQWLFLTAVLANRPTEQTRMQTIEQCLARGWVYQEKFRGGNAFYVVTALGREQLVAKPLLPVCPEAKRPTTFALTAMVRRVRQTIKALDGLTPVDPAYEGLWMDLRKFVNDTSVLW